MSAVGWVVGSYGSAKRHWFVWRQLDGRPQEELCDARGAVRWFGSHEAATRAAKKASE